MRLRVGIVEHVSSAGAIEEDDDKLGQAVTNLPRTLLKRLVGRQAVTKRAQAGMRRLACRSRTGLVLTGGEVSATNGAGK